MSLEDAGIPTVLLATTAFETLALAVARTLGLPDARMVVIEHPLGGIDEAVALAKASAIVEPTLALWTKG